MEKKWIIIQADSEEHGRQINEVLKQQGVYDTHYVLIIGQGFKITIDGIDVSSKPDPCPKLIPHVPPYERMRLESDKDVSESYWKPIAQVSLWILAIVSVLYIIELIG